MSRAARRERSTVVVHAMTAVALLAQGAGKIDDPATPRALVVLPLIGGALAVATVIRHRRQQAPSRLTDVASSVVEALTCAVVGVTSAARGTRYIQYAWFVAALAVLGSVVIKSRRTGVA